MAASAGDRGDFFNSMVVQLLAGRTPSCIATKVHLKGAQRIPQDFFLTIGTEKFGEAGPENGLVRERENQH